MLIEQRLSPEQERARLAVLQRHAIARIRRMEDNTILRLRDAYIEAAREMARVLQGVFAQFGVTAWSVTDVGAPQRRAILFQQLIERIDALTSRIALDLQDSFAQVYRDAYYLHGWQLSQALPMGSVLTLPLLPEQAVIAAMTFPYEGATFFERLGDARLDFITKLRRSITSSQALGEGAYQAQKRLSAELGWPIGRRTKAAAVANKGNFARTEMIARTELLRASNLGAAAVDEANSAIVKAWEWITARDDRVCSICAPLDGKVFSLNSSHPRPPIHPHDRCSSIPVRKTNHELGLPDAPSGFPKRETYHDWAQRTGRPAPE